MCNLLYLAIHICPGEDSWSSIGFYPYNCTKYRFEPPTSNQIIMVHTLGKMKHHFHTSLIHNNFSLSRCFFLHLILLLLDVSNLAERCQKGQKKSLRDILAQVKWFFFSSKTGSARTVCLYRDTRPGKLTVCYWKWPFIVDFPIKNRDFPELC
jgi:hypothetical protein